LADSALPSAEDSSNGAATGIDLAGRQLGDFRLLRRLGRGGMAEVYLAEQSSLRRQVAVKVLKSELATDATYVRRFHLEAQAAAAFVHSNVVQIHEVGHVDGVHYIAQEYVQGQNLRELLGRAGRIDLKQGLTIMRQVAAALHQAAQRGIVHRDIKPENIMLSGSGEVKVADFGLARLTRDATAVNLTQVGLTMGTPLYMSPEQVEGKPLDPRSDIYSLGVTSYQMFAGEPPFRGETALGIAVQHLRSQAERLENLRPDLPPALARIVHKMLEKDPDSRYSTALELLRDLRSVQVEGLEDGELESIDAQLAAEVAAAVHDRQEAARRLEHLAAVAARQRQGRWRWAAIAAVVIVAFVLGGVAAWAARDRYLLAGVGGGPSHVERRPTVQAQLFLAEMTQSESAYQAVALHYPEETLYVRFAEKQLALLYLRRDDYAAALALFDRFADLDPVEEEFRAFGLAGQCIVLSLQGRFQESAARLDALAPIRDKLDPQMQEMLRAIIARNRGQINPADPGNWKAWLEDRLDEEPAGSPSEPAEAPAVPVDNHAAVR
jgi:serine/threonine-protein kinase